METTAAKLDDAGHALRQVRAALSRRLTKSNPPAVEKDLQDCLSRVNLALHLIGSVQ